jgi:ribosomal protein L20A (L18A)
MRKISFRQINIENIEEHSKHQVKQAQTQVTNKS